MSNLSLDLRSYSAEISSHSHDFAQFVLPIRGVMELQTGCHFGVVDKRKAAFIAAGETHSFSASRDNRFLVVDLKEQFLISDLSQLPPFLTLTATTDKFLNFVQSYLHHKNRDLFADNLVQQLLLKLLAPLFISNQDQVVLKAKHWIDKNFALPINIAKLTQICHLSTSQLQRRFKKSTGTTISDYWRKKKLSQAQLLLGTNLSIEAIAYQVGYENLSAFSRRFSQIFSLSPSQWREMTLAAHKMQERDKY